MAGAPIGNTNKAKGKAVASMIAKRLEERQLLQVIVDAQLDKAADGDYQAANMIFDRLDGKPKQQTEITGLDDGAIMIGKVERVIIDKRDVIDNTPD